MSVVLDEIQGFFMLRHVIMKFSNLLYYAIASADGILMSVRRRVYIFKT